MVRLQGLPFKFSVTDIVKFFASLDVVDCLLTHKNEGFSGEAFVGFPMPLQAGLALELDRQMRVGVGGGVDAVFGLVRRANRNGDRKSGIKTTTRVNIMFSWVVKLSQRQVNAGPAQVNDKAERQPTGNSHVDNREVAKLRGLTFSVTETDVVIFFYARLGGGCPLEPCPMTG
ncbi:uncharacterized protein LOC144712037 [Wolffia australiana]